MKIRKARVPVLPEFVPIILDNGARFYPINRGSIPALKLELTFPAGRIFEEKKGISTATLQLIKGGTKNKSATKLAEGFDFWGSSINFDFYIDTVGIKVYALEKYLPKVLPLVVELLTVPSFPLTEIKLYKRQQKEKLKSDESRGDVLAYRAFTENLYGSEHPYGYNSTEELIESITQKDLADHFKRCYNMSDCNIFLAGNFQSATADLVMKTLGDIPSLTDLNPHFKGSSRTKPYKKVQILRPEAVQTSIRLGRAMFTRNHPDYVPMFVLNAILGGYYGSRLMQHLREKKGLTYHIYSSLDTFMLDGYFLISTEVDNERTNVALKAVYAEIESLRTKKVPYKELDSIKNYLTGNFLNYFENAFSYSELVRMLSIEGGAITFNDLVSGVSEVSPDQILKVAQKYFKEKDLTEVQVGRF